MESEKVSVDFGPWRVLETLCLTDVPGCSMFRFYRRPTLHVIAFFSTL